MKTPSEENASISSRRNWFKDAALLGTASIAAPVLLASAVWTRWNL
jgi:hypothetical protein